MNIQQKNDMEHLREDEIRGGRSGSGPAGENSRTNPLDGFEGMNYEQRRESYFPKRQQQAYKNGVDAQSSAQHDLDGRNPI